MLVTVYVAVGGALGSALRYSLNAWLTPLIGDALPWGTILINIAGSFVIGLFTALFAGAGASTPIEMRQFVLVGLCGGFTTFSSFSLQTLTLLDAGEPGRAVLNIALSMTLCLIAVALGTIVPGAVAALSRSVGA
ncbi:fluoride efflux transporter CrcB [Kaistia geumhonensis]|uniref:Fluoride-specific ion channel FluC n=1 Tax=Kaistia geumhonensis TaxID=410839 RepID=A0ABU0M993_9HYPH|nr:fluoride efflux transporter CrcB [Kaistia geumhonensis]MCX5477460.1 fluoride efflux transporter CrcB [Kaistia geumhonensis]MDQ0517333.1 CrcB protein [Kaistia geumhonensis]